MGEVQRYTPTDDDATLSAASISGEWVRFDDYAAIEARLEALVSSLKDPVIVHTNILRGTIALTRAQAIHIAGLRADIEERYREALEVLRSIVDAVVVTPIMRDTECLRKLDYALGWKANDELAERLANNELTMAREVLKEKP